MSRRRSKEIKEIKEPIKKPLWAEASRGTFQIAHWEKEVKEKGTYLALLARLEFHAGLDLATMVEYTGLSNQTIRKHMRRMVANNDAIESLVEDYWRFNFKFDWTQ